MAKVLAFDNYFLFECSKEKCVDTCCYGNHIFIDEEKYKGFELIVGPIGKEICSKIIKTEDKYLINKDEKNQCKFLNDDGLCFIQKNLSSNYLPSECNKYPRSNKVINNIVQMNLSLICPEVIKKIIMTNKKINFVIYNFDEDDIENIINKEETNLINGYTESFIYDLRISCLEILKNENLSLNSKLMYIGTLVHSLNDEENKEEKNMRDILKEHILHLKNKEITDYLNKETRNIDKNNDMYLKFIDIINKSSDKIIPVHLNANSNYEMKVKFNDNKNKIEKMTQDEKVEYVKNNINKIDDYFTKNEQVLENLLTYSFYVSNAFIDNNFVDTYYSYLIYIDLFKVFTAYLININEVVDDNIIMSSIVLFYRHIVYNKDVNKYTATYINS